MTSPIPRFEPMTAGLLLDRALQLYRTNFSLMFGITAVAYVPFHLLTLAVDSILGFDPASWSGLGTTLYFVVSMLLWSSIGYPLAAGAATYAISERYLGNEVTISAALRRSLSAFKQLSMASLTATIRVILGFALLIVPGVLWALSYSLTVPAILVENLTARRGLARSRELIGGYRKKAAAIIALSVTLQFVIGIGLGMLADWLAPAEAGEKTLLSSVVESFVVVLFTPFFEIATILLYYDMRIRKEGFDLDMLSRAFGLQPDFPAGAAVPSD